MPVSDPCHSLHHMLDAKAAVQLGKMEGIFHDKGLETRFGDWEKLQVL